jgi:hypothetical protein
LNLIAIDPGKSGGIVWTNLDGTVSALKMPQTPLDILNALRDRAETSSRLVCYIEKVGSSRPGNSAKSSTTFARHCGHLDMALLAAEVSTIQVTSQKWMKFLGIPGGLDLKDRKSRIKDAMQRRYPYLRVTDWSADALGILTYAIDRKGEGK